MAGLHTHDGSGKLHAEGLERATLGEFFSIWGVAFSKDRLGPAPRDVGQDGAAVGRR